MQFTLHYRGPLKSNGTSADKHTIRRHFHGQLKQVWGHLPLKAFPELLTPPDPVGNKGVSVLCERHGFVFASLVSSKVHLVAELDIRILWPQELGAIISSGGDLDNRLKTLLDSLKVPSEPSALPPGTKPGEGEEPFFCLLEDDSLITKLTVEADRLLELSVSPSVVELWITVRTRQLHVLMGTIGLA